MISIVHIGLCRFHYSVKEEIENVFFETDWNEFLLSLPIHQFRKMNSHSLTNFAVNRNHVPTTVSEVEILSSSARDLCSTAKHFVFKWRRFSGRSATCNVNVNATGDMTKEHTEQRKWLSVSHLVDVHVVVRTLHTVLMGARTGHMAKFFLSSVTAGRAPRDRLEGWHERDASTPCGGNFDPRP